jgi:TolA-binding protein
MVIVQSRGNSSRAELTKRKEGLMKTNLIHTMTIVFLVTSISAFAQIDHTKREAAATTCNTTQMNDSNPEASDPAESNVSLELEQLQQEVHQLEIRDKLNQEEKQKTMQKDKGKIRQDNKELDHSLLGIYG